MSSPKKIYLVQRMSFSGVFDPNAGVDANFHLHYMGSSEFEFGALPQSLQRIGRKLSQAEVNEVPEIKSPDGESLFVLGCCLDEGYKEQLSLLARGELYTKESPGMKEYLKGKNSAYWRVGGDPVWWDIDNDVFFCFGREAIEKVRQAVKNVAVKKGWLVLGGDK